MKPNIDPKVDCVFKAILGSEAHKPVLIHFLNAVLAADADWQIHEVELLNPYNEREFETDKLSVVDVKASDDAGRWYQIEIQLALHEGLTSRMLYTWSTIYHGLLAKGRDFSALHPVISIWLLNDTLFNHPGAWHLPFALWNHEHRCVLSDDLRIDVLQLPEWRGDTKMVNELDRWMYLFTRGEEVDVADPPAILQTPEMQEAMTVLQHFSENEREYLLYQKRLDAQRVEMAWQTQIAQLQTVAAHERQEKEKERRAKERERRAKEQERRAKEQAQQREAQERQEKERTQQENDRLLTLLKQAGIDPNQVEKDAG